MNRTRSILTILALFAAGALAPVCAQKSDAQAGGNRLLDMRTGTVATREGLRLRLVTDIGNVQVITDDTSPHQVSYSVRIETDARQPEARALLQQFRVTDGGNAEGVYLRGSAPWKKEFRGRLWVTFEVRVPRQYDIEVETGAGNIDTGEIRGRAALVSQGGNITAGRIHGSARMNTAGGHIKLKDVEGDLTAITGGGHIEVGDIAGVAMLQSAGGHVKAQSVRKWADLRTAGGNIALNRTGGKTVVESGGGQINLGDVAGAVQAKTGGGAIQIRRVTGPMNIQTAGGSIVLEQVLNPVQANTGSGQITAWFAATGQKEIVGPSQLVCGQGDILVYLPRGLAVNIEATIEAAGEHRIIHAEGLPMKTTYVRSPNGPRTLRGEAVLNGGGQVLKLHTVSGNIKLAYAENAAAGSATLTTVPPAVEAEKKSRLESLRDRINYMRYGNLPVDADTQARKLVRKVEPQYPDRARREGVQGWVWVHLLIGENGAVEEATVASGHPWLAEAAADALKQWRYQPTYLDGKPVKVSTMVKVVFTMK